MRLAEFQRDFITAVYDNEAGTRRAFLSIARKNGKTGLIAALLLVHLVGPEARQNSQIVSGAMSREQAGIVFNLASKMVELSPQLATRVQAKASTKELFGVGINTHYRALAAEGKTAHGLSPILAILDEVGQVQGPKNAFVDAITTSQGAHEAPLLIAISTQAASDADLLSVWLDDAAKSGDPRIVSHVYAAPADCELDDPEAWSAANPALGTFRSLPDVEQQAAEAKRMPSAEATFRNLCLNQRVAVTNPFMSKATWDACSAAPDSLDGLEVFGGLDLSQRTDLTALVLIGRKGSDWQVHPTFWAPADGLINRARRDRVPYDVWRDQGFLRTTPGKVVDLEVVARDIANITDGLDLQALAYDRWRMPELQRELDRLGIALPLVPHGQGFKDMAPALDHCEAEFLNGRAAHGGHPVLTMNAAGAVVTRDPAGNRKLDKSKATARIDGMVALAMAFGAAINAEPAEPEPTYQLFFL
ncbi:MAG: terminase large subunit [Zoogloeaceae bacterium]|nr:terminase large subunit [Zoogloeaceae bacterium]